MNLPRSIRFPSAPGALLPCIYPRTLLALLTGVLCLLLPGRSDAAPIFAHRDVFVSGQDGYHTYRIPAIETAPDGSLIAFAEARKYNADDPGYGKQDIDLVFKRSTDQGVTWSPMTVLEDPGELWSAANPATVVDRTTGRVWVFYLRSRPGRSTETSRPGTDDMQTLARWSADNGQTWSEPSDLTAVGRDLEDKTWRASVPGPGGAIQTRTGRLIVPMWKAPFATFAMFSNDHGRTWQRGSLVPGDQGGDENQVVELADGTILMDIRQEAGPHRWLAQSTDGGRTWNAPRPGIEVTPVMCAIERFTSRAAGDDCDRLLWTGPQGPGRRRLVLRASYDEGKTFTHERLISEEHAAYSDLTLLKDRTVGILWERGVERGYQFLTFTRLNREWIEPSPESAAAATPDTTPTVIRSTDAGRTWSEPIPIGKGSGVRLDAETDFVRLKDGTLYAALRGDQTNMHFAVSPDDGLTWSTVKDIGLPGHCPHFLRLRSGGILLTHRLPLTELHLSRDEAQTSAAS